MLISRLIVTYSELEIESRVDDLSANFRGVCLFCRGNGPFTTVEHIVPESLGNDTDVLRDVVCDQCQNYLGRAVEKPAFDATPFGFWRTVLGTKTKTGALPNFSSLPQRSGAFPSEHPLTDRFRVSANEDASTTLNVAQPHNTLDGRTPQLKIVYAPWHIFTMGRFLGKIGLEYLALKRPDVAMSKSLDQIRNYVRRGSVGWIWPIYFGRSGEFRDLRTSVALADGTLEIETECYRYSLGEHVDGGYVFAFGIGIEVYVIDFFSPAPGRLSEKLIDGVSLSCLHYSKSELKAQKPPSTKS